MANEYLQGWRAAQRDTATGTVSANPYAVNSARGKDWAEGYWNYLLRRRH